MKIITWNVNGLRSIWKKGELQKLIKKTPVIFRNNLYCHYDQHPIIAYFIIKLSTQFP